MLLRHRRPGFAGNLVSQRHKDQGALLAGLALNRADGREAAQALAQADRLVEGEAAAGPHSSRQVDRRQELAACLGTVGAKLGLGRHRQEIEPVPGGRNRVARPDGRFGQIEHRRQCPHRCRAGDVCGGPAAANPGGVIAGVCVGNSRFHDGWPLRMVRLGASAPERNAGRVDQTAVEAQPGLAVAGEQQRGVEIHPIGILGQQHGRGDGEG